MVGTAPKSNATMAPGTPPVPAANTATTQAAAAGVNPMEVIDQIWKNAERIRAGINKELQRLQNPEKDVDRVMMGFERIEDLLAKYRLGCIQVIMADIKEAKEKKVEDALWLTHTEVTTAYRNTIKGLPGSGNVVTRRKIEKYYANYLKTSQSFYKVYLQRFCGRYKMKELERVARIIKFDEQVETGPPMPDASDPTVQDLVNSSFHKTLICLGDLSRYRTILQGRNRSFTSALTYYALANELIPQSPFGYHQSGIIYRETQDHFEVVYCMYRAVACELPHPLATVNLERELQDLRQSNAGSGARGSVEAMAAWFVKLHAYYYRADESTQNIQKELEKEVTNRLVMSLKAKAEPGIDKVLLKMVLINITAYTVGRKRIEGEWSDAKSRSCQLILRWNIRTIHTVSKFLKDELSELAKQKPIPVAATNGEAGVEGETASKFTLSFHRALPLFRVYMTWLYCYRSELVEFREHLQPEFETMCGTLAQTLTLVFRFLRDHMDTLGGAKSWLFPEDEETIGIECLNGTKLAQECRLRHDAVSGELKPRADEVVDGIFTLDVASIIRSFQIVYCGTRLAEHSGFPIVFSGQEEFSYVEGAGPTEPASHAPIANPQPSVSVGTPAATTGAVSAPRQPTVAPSVPAAVALEMDSEDFSDDQEFFPQAVNKGRRNVSSGTARTLDTPYVAPATEFPIEKQLKELITDYLLPPEPSLGKSASKLDEAYGMGSTTGYEAFVRLNSGGPGSASPTPNSANSKSFPSLPWNFFNIHAPADSTTGKMTRVGSASHDWDSRPASSSSGMAAAGIAGVPNNLSAPRPDLTNDTNRLSGQSLSFQGYASQDWAAQTMEARKALDAQSLQAQKIRDVWGPSYSNPHSRQPSHGSASNPWSPTAGTWTSNPGATGYGAPAFPSSHGFSTDSSLPPVNSPRGVPTLATNQYQGTTQSYRQSPSAYIAAAPSSAGYAGRAPPGFTVPPGFSSVNGPHYTGGYQPVARPSDYGVVEPTNVERQALLDAFTRDTTAKSVGNGFGAISSGRPQVPRNTSVSTSGNTGWNAKAKPK